MYDNAAALHPPSSAISKDSIQSVSAVSRAQCLYLRPLPLLLQQLLLLLQLSVAAV